MGFVHTLALAICGTVLSHAAFPKTMVAVVVTGRAPEYNYSQLKVVNDSAVPEIGPGQILIRVAASSINPADRGLIAAGGGFNHSATKDEPKIVGSDVSGVIVAVGRGCNRLKVGDEVWACLGKGGFAWPQLGAWAEYAVADEDQVGLKPEKMSLAGAGSMGVVGLTGTQAFAMAGLAPYQARKNLTFVITSGAGGTGTVAIQLAKVYGASRVVTASSPRNFDLLKKLGATDVVDYHKGTIWDILAENSVDFVYDNLNAIGSADAAMKSIRPGGAYLFVPGGSGRGPTHPKEGVRVFDFGVAKTEKYEYFDVMKNIADHGDLQAVISKSFQLGGIFEALDYSMHGHGYGKTGITAMLSKESEVVV